METPSSTPAGTSRPSFAITRADGNTVTLQGSSLADALRRYYDDQAANVVVVAIARVDDIATTPDTGFVFGLDVREVEDLGAEVATILIEREIVPLISIDADGSDWAFRVLVEDFPAGAPPQLRTFVAQELDGDWNLSHGSLDQMNALARDWAARQEALHPGLVIARP